MWRAIPNVGFHTDKPIIAATTGWVVGGGIVMVMMCDLMVSTEDTHVLLSGSQARHDRGRDQFPGRPACRTSWRWRSCCWAPRSPPGALTTSASSTASLPNGEHETEALAMAAQLVESAPLVIGALKRLVNEIMPTGPIERMVAVSQTIAKVRQSDDLQEGIRAYKEKRKPRFTGR